MLTLTINGTSVDPSDEGEIARTIRAYNVQDMAVCVQVVLKTPDVDIVLSTDACGGGGGGGRAPNAQEAAIFDLWHRHELRSGRFPPGQLIAFLKKLM